MLLLSITKWHDLLDSQLLVYNGDRQAPPDLLNLLPEGTDLDPDVWLAHHKSIPAFPCLVGKSAWNSTEFCDYSDFDLLNSGIFIGILFFRS
jgi:hypothetical protein